MHHESTNIIHTDRCRKVRACLRGYVVIVGRPGHRDTEQVRIATKITFGTPPVVNPCQDPTGIVERHPDRGLTVRCAAGPEPNCQTRAPPLLEAYLAGATRAEVAPREQGPVAKQRDNPTGRRCRAWQVESQCNRCFTRPRLAAAGARARPGQWRARGGPYGGRYADPGRPGQGRRRPGAGARLPGTASHAPVVLMTPAGMLMLQDAGTDTAIHGFMTCVNGHCGVLELLGQVHAKERPRCR
jgi:hypothetical protein